MYLGVPRLSISRIVIVDWRQISIRAGLLTMIIYFMPHLWPDVVVEFMRVSRHSWEGEVNPRSAAKNGNLRKGLGPIEKPAEGKEVRMETQCADTERSLAAHGPGMEGGSKVVLFRANFVSYRTLWEHGGCPDLVPLPLLFRTRIWISS